MQHWAPFPFLVGNAGQLLIFPFTTEFIFIVLKKHSGWTYMGTGACFYLTGGTGAVFSIHAHIQIPADLSKPPSWMGKEKKKWEMFGINLIKALVQIWKTPDKPCYKSPPLYFCHHFPHFDISSFLNCLFRIRYPRPPAAAQVPHLMDQSPKEQDLCFLCLSASSFKGWLRESSSPQHAVHWFKKPRGLNHTHTCTHTHRKLRT